MDLKAVILFFNISGGELLIILLAVLIIFGPGKIPEIARYIGKTINDLRTTTGDLAKELRNEADGLSSEIHNTVVNPIVESGKTATQMPNQPNSRNDNPGDDSIPDIYLNAGEQNAGSNVDEENIRSAINSEGSVIANDDTSYPVRKNE